MNPVDIPFSNCASRWPAIYDCSVFLSAVTNDENASGPALGNITWNNNLFLSLVVASCINLSASSSVSTPLDNSLSTRGSGLTFFIRYSEHFWRTPRCLSSISWKLNTRDFGKYDLVRCAVIVQKPHNIHDDVWALLALLLGHPRRWPNRLKAKFHYAIEIASWIA